MASERVTVRLEAEMAQRLEDLAIRRSQTASELVREAVRRLIDDEDDRSESAFDAAKRAGIMGMVDDLPEDLSTNPRHFEGFGER